MTSEYKKYMFMCFYHQCRSYLAGVVRMAGIVVAVVVAVGLLVYLGPLEGKQYLGQLEGMQYLGPLVGMQWWL